MGDVNDERTESVASEPRAKRDRRWSLIAAFDCQDIGSVPDVTDLTDVTEVSIERLGTPEKIADDRRVRIGRPDRWMSLQHARIGLTDGDWWLHDCGSRNGTMLNGRPVTRAPLGDGDVVQCGGTFFVLRRGEVRPQTSRSEALRTVSPALQAELDILMKVAQSPIAILVMGESGTGKDGIARAVHELSGREGPFVAVNCGALPATLIESELFGARRGAFSGAADRPGLVRAAHKGTLFLDEVTDLPLASQAALLRVLQEKEVLPLGTSRPIPVDVRVVAATNRPRGSVVSGNILREDLYARLSGYELCLPPLSQRREDLGLLLATLIAKHDRSGRRRSLSRAAAAALFAYRFPWNIRELELSVCAALAIADEEIGVEHLMLDVHENGRPAQLE